MITLAAVWKLKESNDGENSKEDKDDGPGARGRTLMGSTDI